MTSTGIRRGKEHERATAKRLGGERVGNTGHASADVVSDWLSIECKARKLIPLWIQNAVEQARANCDGQRLHIAVLHEIGAYHRDDLVIVRLADFESWFGDCQDLSLSAGEEQEPR